LYRSAKAGTSQVGIGLFFEEPTMGKGNNSHRKEVKKKKAKDKPKPPPPRR
jgi:hypothetical protein